MQSPYPLRGTVWIVVYLFFILAPLFALLVGSHPPARDFWTEFSVAIGYSGLAMMGLQFGLTARFRYVTEPWGEDVIYHFHRQISLVAVGPGRRAPDHPVHRPAGAARAAQLHHGAVARPLCRAVDLLADRAGRDGAVAHEAEAPLRNVAPHPHRARGRRRRGGDRCTWSAGASTWCDPWKRALWIASDDLLDRAAALRAHRQAAVHASPAVPRSRRCARSAATPGRW